MTHFRFRYKRIGYIRWRCRTARVRTAVLVLPLTVGARYAPSMAAWRRLQPVAVLPTPVSPMLKVGSYLVGEESDPQITGHPDIRY